MGEIARRIIQRLAEEGALFGRRVPAALKTKNALSTPQMSQIDHDTSTDLLRTADILQEACGLAVDQITLQSTQVVRKLQSISWFTPCLYARMIWQPMWLVLHCLRFVTGVISCTVCCSLCMSLMSVQCTQVYPHPIT